MANKYLTGFDQEQIAALAARIHHDEDVKVYFNGVLAFEESGYLTAYKNIPLNQEAIDALMPDDTNVIAIECTNRGGGQYIDFGLTGIKPIPTGIREVKGEKLNVKNDAGPDEAIYDLAGRRISARANASSTTLSPKGINIVKGRKILY